jgi:membrane protein DedA with SNARE-associated domain
VLIGRVTPVVRSFVSIPAGVFRVGLGRYTALTLVGSAVWCFAFAGVGWAVGSSYKNFDHGFRYAEIAIVAGVLLLAAYVVLRRRRPSRLDRRASDPPG